MKLWFTIRRQMSSLFNLQPDSDFFAVLNWQLLLSGVNLKSNRIWLRALFRVHQLITPAQCVIWLYRTMIVAFVERNSTLALNLYCGQFAFLAIAIRHVLSLTTYGKLEPVRCYINSQRYLRDHPKAHELRQHAFRTNNILVVALVTYSWINFLIYEVCNMQWHAIFRMPDSLVRENPQVALMLQIIMHPMSLYGLGAFISSFLIMHTVLKALQAEFLLVEYSLAGLLQRIVQVQPITREAEQQDGLLWRLLNGELSHCVREHCEVKKHVRDVNRILSLSILAQYYTTLLALAIDTFFISYNGLDFVTLMVLTFSLLLVFEWYYCCKLVEDLQATNERIGWSLYNDSWTTWLQYGRCRQQSLRQYGNTLSIMLQASQRRLSFHGSNIIEVSWQTFGNLFKLSYSVLMFLFELRKLNR